MDTTEAIDQNPPAGAEQRLLYRCVCGVEFEVDLEQGGSCSRCSRTVQPEALKTAMSATVSIANIEEPVCTSCFELHENEDLRHETYGHFRLDKKLGSGGMGAVYRALDTSLQRFVAVKVMRQPNQNLDARIATMLREAIAQARLNHPHVVTIYYVGREGEEPFLAMELLPGPTLAEKLKSDGPIPYADAIRYGIQVASALDHASQFGIIHGDIKPGNLIQAAGNSIKLSDFGLSSHFGLSHSNLLEPANPKETVSGTPAYFAPELLNGARSFQSDMYALGVTLFELVFGRTPFELKGSSVRERLKTHLTASIDYPQVWPRHIPREFSNLLDRLLAKAPENRYSSYSDLLTDLKAVEPVSTTNAGLASRSMAYVVDQGLLLFCLLPFALSISLLSDKQFRAYVWMVPMIAFLSLVVPTIYLTFIYRGWRSLGRYLFQLRIVDENGLAPRKEQLVTREVFRNSMSWIGPLLIYVTLFYEGVGYWPHVGLALFILADAAFGLFGRSRQSLHDFLSRSRVVLATDEQNSYR